MRKRTPALISFPRFDQNCGIWFHSDQPHRGAVDAYLTALFRYFELLVRNDVLSPLSYTGNEWTIEYRLVDDDTGLVSADAALSNIEVISLEEASTEPALLGLSNGSAVMSANKFIGFGQTGTQEETQVGASPEACPAVLFTPPLQDNQALVVTGVEAMVSIAGYGRDARLGEILESSSNHSQHRERWSKRKMLFMDAMELDVVETHDGLLADLQPGNVKRELRKAYIGFKACQKMSPAARGHNIYTGFWGCRTFGGNPEVKFCIQWCAASLAACDLHFICSGQQQQDFAEKLKVFVQEMQSQGYKAGDLRDVLVALKPTNVLAEETPWQAIRRALARHSEC